MQLFHYVDNLRSKLGVLFCSGVVLLGSVSKAGEGRSPAVEVWSKGTWCGVNSGIGLVGLGAPMSSTLITNESSLFPM